MTMAKRTSLHMTTEKKRKNTFDEDEEDVDYENENTISRSSSIR